MPPILGKMLEDKDPARSRRVMEAMLKMVKFDIAALEEAYRGAPARRARRARAPRAVRRKTGRSPRR